jgi:hypothetical protein
MWEGGGDLFAFGPKRDLFPTNTLGGGAVHAHAEFGRGVDLSSTTAGTAVELGTADPVPEGNLTLVFAGRLDTLPGASDFAGLIVKRDTFSNGDMRWAWFINSSGGGNNFGFNNPDTSIALTVVPSLGYHVWMLTDDGTSTRVYEDGVIVETVADSLEFDSDTAAGLRIGNSQTDGTEQFEGACDCVYMFERVLSPGETAIIARDPHGLSGPSLRRRHPCSSWPSRRSRLRRPTCTRRSPMYRASRQRGTSCSRAVQRRKEPSRVRIAT